ncbi:DMT family transporter [Weissella cibaria]|uniref:DMT family transporter n=1 Tax=Weissella cibaria TaxID=137591 RepID=UPI0007061F17|nr:DMT family transporter [Weissella cibaria]ALI33782.1 hypothetical protein AO080_10130 [Weissella cibaria]
MFYLLGLLGSFAVSNQSPINARLGGALKSPFRAAFLSFSLGVIFLGLLAFMQNPHFLGDILALTKTGQPWWIYSAGIFSMLYQTSNILLFKNIGAVKTVVLPTLGQVVMSMIIQTLGWVGAETVALTAVKVIGVVLVIIGVLVAVVLSARLETKSGSTKSSSVFWHVWGILTGMFASFQQAITGHLGHLLGAPVDGAFVSFVGALILLTILVAFKERPFFNRNGMKGAPWWSFLGGIPGALFVFFIGIVVPVLGPGMGAILGLMGMLIGTIIVQQFGWYQSIKKQVNVMQVIGIIIMVAGVVMIQLV